MRVNNTGLFIETQAIVSSNDQKARFINLASGKVDTTLSFPFAVNVKELQECIVTDQLVINQKVHLVLCSFSRQAAFMCGG